VEQTDKSLFEHTSSFENTPDITGIRTGMESGEVADLIVFIVCVSAFIVYHLW